MRDIDVAVIGMAGKFPGANNVETFWKNLLEARETLSFYSDEELKKRGVSKDQLNNSNYIRCFGNIDGVDYFDADFFNYSYADAKIMNPQTRLFHECVWHVLEDTGYVPGKSEGRIGLFATAADNLMWDAEGLIRQLKFNESHFESHIFGSKEHMCSQIAYRLGLNGPVLMTQTACSSSLVAIHLATQSIINGECDIAIAGGIKLSIPQQYGYTYQEGMVSSKDGHCRAFDDEATGFVTGNGFGCVALKLLEDAVANKDQIYAVIKGSYINNDGNKRLGYTVPSIEGQAKVIRRSMQVAEVKPEDVKYVETHGTGTILGDPVEISALDLAFNTSKKKYCAIGSVKTNIGHLDIAAGIASFIKVANILKNGIIPASLNFTKPNNQIDFRNSPFYVNTSLQKVEADEQWHAGVSSFGIGGTNAHITLSNYNYDKERQKERKYKLFLISAKTENALNELSLSYINFLKNNPQIDIGDLAFTQHVGRDDFKYRKGIVIETVSELNIESDNYALLNTPVIKLPQKKLPIVFMFSGLGKQYINMGRELYEHEPVFREKQNECFNIINELLEIDFKNILYPNSQTQLQHSNSIIYDFIEGQFSVFVYEYALANLLLSWGIVPDYVLGYSFGEYTAACISGILKLHDALRLIYLRGLLVNKTEEGKMLTVPFPVSKAKKFIEGDIDIAIDLGETCIISGTIDSIKNLEEKLKVDRYLAFSLNSKKAIHSQVMDSILEEFLKIVEKIPIYKPQIPIISNLTGTLITNDQLNAQYWVDQLRKPVLFSKSLQTLMINEPLCIEIGPGNDLTSIATRYMDNELKQRCINVGRTAGSNISEEKQLMLSILKMWRFGVSINWKSFYKYEEHYKVSLPKYPFAKNSFKTDVNLTNQIISEYRSLELLKLQQNKIDEFGNLYIPSWKPLPLLEDKNEVKNETILWFEAGNKFEEHIVSKLRKENKVIIVKRGIKFEKVDDNCFALGVQDADYDLLFAELKYNYKKIDRIFHCWSLIEVELDNKSFLKEQEKGLFSLVNIAKSINKQSSSEVKLTVLTSKVFGIQQNSNIIPERSTLLSACKIIPQEFPNIKTKCINVDLNCFSKINSAIAVAIVNDLLSNSDEPLIAYNKFKRLRPDYQNIKHEEVFSTTLKIGGTYIITGGLGQIGMEIACFLLKEYKANVVLTTRTNIATEFNTNTNLIAKKARLKEFVVYGGDFKIITANVSNFEQMSKTIKIAEENYGKINGVVHAAGVVGKQIVKSIVDVHGNDFQEQFTAKVEGLYILFELLKGKEIDFCLCTSSLSPYLGGYGFLAYAAANQFMDSFVEKANNSTEKPFMRILNYEGWKHINSQESDTHKFSISEEEGVEVFKKVMALPQYSQVINSNGNFNERVNVWIRNIYNETASEIVVQQDDKKNIREHRDITVQFVPAEDTMEQEIIGMFEKMFSCIGIGVNDNFFELGGDSVKAIQLVSWLYKQYEVKISLKEIYECLTVRQIAKLIGKAKKIRYSEMKFVEKKDFYPMSPSQKSMYILNKLSPNNLVYNVVSFFEMSSDFDIDKLQLAFQGLVKDYEVFRTVFQIINGEPVQKVCKPFLPEIFTRNIEENKLEKALKDFIRAFKLEDLPLFRICIYYIDNGDVLMAIDLHHILADALSMFKIKDHLMTLFNGDTPQKIKFQFKDYANWMNSPEILSKLEEQEEYWKNRLSVLPRVDLPIDFDRPKVKSSDGEIYKFVIDKETTNNLNQLAVENNCSLYNLLLSNYNIFLKKLTGLEEIIIRTTVTGRNHHDLENMVGIFINTVAIKNKINISDSFKDFLERVKNNVANDFSNADLPFDDVASKIKAPKDLARSSIADIGFDLFDRKEINEIVQESAGDGVKYSYSRSISYCDFRITFFDYGTYIQGEVEYCTKLFLRQSIESMVNEFMGVIDDVVKAKGKVELVNIIDKIPNEKSIQIGKEIDQNYAEQSLDLQADFDF